MSSSNSPISIFSRLRKNAIPMSLPPRIKDGVNSGGIPDAVPAKAGNHCEGTGFLSTQETLDSCLCRNDILRQSGRSVPLKPRLVGGVKGYNMKRHYLTGKPRPVAGELHFFSTF
jgi:hypothetical protein